MNDGFFAVLNISDDVSRDLLNILGPSRDNVPGTKHGTRYLVPYPVSLKVRDQGADPVYLVLLVPAGILPGILA